MARVLSGGPRVSDPPSDHVPAVMRKEQNPKTSIQTVKTPVMGLRQHLMPLPGLSKWCLRVSPKTLVSTYLSFLMTRCQPKLVLIHHSHWDDGHCFRHHRPWPPAVMVEHHTLGYLRRALGAILHHPLLVPSWPSGKQWQLFRIVCSNFGRCFWFRGSSICHRQKDYPPYGCEAWRDTSTQDPGSSIFDWRIFPLSQWQDDAVKGWCLEVKPAPVFPDSRWHG